MASGYGVHGTEAVAEVVKGMNLAELRDYLDPFSVARMKKDDILVSTGPIPNPHEVIGPVYFQLSNKGLLSSTFSDLSKKYAEETDVKKRAGAFSPTKVDWGVIWGGIAAMSVGQNSFDEAFYIATQELRLRAAMMGGDAIIHMRVDIDLDTNGFQFFYLQMYGTAVRFIE